MPLSFSKSEKLDESARYLALGMGISVALHIPPLVSITSGFLVLCWIFALTNPDNFSKKWKIISRNPVAVTALAFWVVIGLGMLYGEQSWGDALAVWAKYRKLFLIAILITLMQDSKWRRWCEFGFIGTMLMMVAARYWHACVWWWADSSNLGFYAPENEWGHITHNILTSFTIYWLIQEVKYCSNSRNYWILLAAIALSVGDILFLTPGRSGWVVFSAMSMLIFYQQFKWKGIIYSVLFILLTGTFAFQFSLAFNTRFLNVLENIEKYNTGDTDTSQGQRIEFYRHSLEIISEHPVLGTGTGSFSKEYKKHIKEWEHPSVNPHNDYFVIGTQLGLVGLSIFLYMLLQQWKISASLPDRRESAIAKGVILTLASGSLFNSLLFDFHEGHFYAYFIGVLYAGIWEATPPDVHVLKSA